MITAGNPVELDPNFIPTRSLLHVEEAPQPPSDAAIQNVRQMLERGDIQRALGLDPNQELDPVTQNKLIAHLANYTSADDFFRNFRPYSAARLHSSLDTILDRTSAATTTIRRQTPRLIAKLRDTADDLSYAFLISADYVGYRWRRMRDWFREDVSTNVQQLQQVIHTIPTDDPVESALAFGEPFHTVIDASTGNFGSVDAAGKITAFFHESGLPQTAQERRDNTYTDQITPEESEPVITLSSYDSRINYHALARLASLRYGYLGNYQEVQVPGEPEFV